METNLNCKKCGKPLNEGEGVNGLCDKCPTSPYSPRPTMNGVELTEEEVTLLKIAKIILVIGIILSVIFAFTLTTEDIYNHTEFSIIGFGITIATFLSTLFSWAVISCLVQISTNIRKLADKNK